jgi:peptidoglycan/xylan/chitin deacetylase (PgdA/CDA1 family)
MPRRRLTAGLAALALVLAVATAIVTRGGGHFGHGGRERRGALPALVPLPPLSPPARRARSRESAAFNRVVRYARYLSAGSARRREVALTFDDGPSAYTAAIQRTLRAHRATATFFPVGVNLDRYPAALRVEAERFAVANHTVNHAALGRLPPAKQRSEIFGEARRLRRHGVPYPHLVRPPYGSYDHDTFAILRRARMLMVLWSIDTEDYTRPGRAKIVSAVLGSVRPGSIVLMHDGGGPREQTVAALPAILRGLARRGYRTVTVSRLLLDDPPPRRQRFPPKVGGAG